MMLNLLLPGAGQFYLGQTAWGGALAVGFIACFVTMLTLFLRAYTKYLELSTSGDLLTGDNIEQLARVFPTGWLLGLLGLSIVIYLASAFSLATLRRNYRPGASDQPRRDPGG
jgi:hypothetical protein